MNKNGKNNAGFERLYFQAKKVMTHPQIASAILQVVAEWNSEIEASVKKQSALLEFFRASKITGLLTRQALHSFLTGTRKPPQWVLIALKEVVKRHVKKDNEASK